MDCSRHHSWTLSSGAILATGSNYTIDESETNPGMNIRTASATDNDGASITSTQRLSLKIQIPTSPPSAFPRHIC